MPSAEFYYPNPPITEAIIDLRVTPSDGKTLDDLRAVQTGLDEYAKRETIHVAVGRMEFGKKVSASAASEAAGVIFHSSDGKQIWQSRFNGFTFSRLAPYERWQLFRDEARQLWVRYREKLQPPSITRLAVRYINRIDLPCEHTDIDRYFKTKPVASPELPQVLAGFFMQLRIPQEDLKAEALINQTMVPPAREGVVSVVLDVDLFRSTDVPSDEEDIWHFFEQLRDRKNSIFESCITDQTRELFQ